MIKQQITVVTSQERAPIAKHDQKVNDLLIKYGERVLQVENTPLDGHWVTVILFEVE
jgi:hypothetical protein